jgi:hypothetical protein
VRPPRAAFDPRGYRAWRLIAYQPLVGRIMAGIKLSRETGTAHLPVTDRISDLIGSSQ